MATPLWLARRRCLIWQGPLPANSSPVPARVTPSGCAALSRCARRNPHPPSACGVELASSRRLASSAALLALALWSDTRSALGCDLDRFTVAGVFCSSSAALLVKLATSSLWWASKAHELLHQRVVAVRGARVLLPPRRAVVAVRFHRRTAVGRPWRQHLLRWRTVSVSDTCTRRITRRAVDDGFRSLLPVSTRDLRAT